MKPESPSSGKNLTYETDLMLTDEHSRLIPTKMTAFLIMTTLQFPSELSKRIIS